MSPFNNTSTCEQGCTNSSVAEHSTPTGSVRAGMMTLIPVVHVCVTIVINLCARAAVKVVLEKQAVEYCSNYSCEKKQSPFPMCGGVLSCPAPKHKRPHWTRSASEVLLVHPYTQAGA